MSATVWPTWPTLLAAPSLPAVGEPLNILPSAFAAPLARFILVTISSSFSPGYKISNISLSFLVIPLKGSSANLLTVPILCELLLFNFSDEAAPALRAAIASSFPASKSLLNVIANCSGSFLGENIFWPNSNCFTESSINAQFFRVACSSGDISSTTFLIVVS